MTKQDYSDYSNIPLETIESNVINLKNLLQQDIQSQSDINILLNSKNFIYDFLKLPFLFDKTQMISKYQAFSPHMLSLIVNSNYSSMIEHMGGVGVLSEIIKEMNPTIKISFNSINNEIYEFTKWRFNRNEIDIKTTNTEDTYDIVVSDGIIQYLDTIQQESIIRNMIQMVNKNGILCLLIDISGSNSEEPLKKDVDITNIHSILEYSDMVCIYGKNTFSSIWKKMM